MLKEKIEKLIAQSMKEHNADKLSVYREVKCVIDNHVKVKGNIDEQTEIQLVSKLIKERKDDIKDFRAGRRQDLVDKAENDIAILQTLIPSQASADEIEKALRQCPCWDEGMEGLFKNRMGEAIKYIKSVLPTADGSEVANIVKIYVFRPLSQGLYFNSHFSYGFECFGFVIIRACQKISL